MSSLTVEARESSRNTKQLRREGLVPAVIYGRNLEESISIQLSASAATKLLKSSTIGAQIEITLGDETMNTMLKDTQYDPVSYKVQHLDFQVLTTGEKVTITAHINLLNKDKIEAGGILQELAAEIEYTALPKDLLDHIDLDLDGLKIGDVIKVKDLPIFSNDKYNVHAEADMDIIVLSAQKVISDEDADGATGEASADVPVIGAEE